MKIKLSLLILMLVFLITNKLSAQENNIKSVSENSSFNKNKAFIDKEPVFFPIRNLESTPHSKETDLVSLGSSSNVFGLLQNRQNYLSYDSLTNTLAYIHRGNGTTHPSGVIVADYSKDGGTTWTNNSIILADNRVTTGNTGNRYPNVAILNKGTTNPDDLIIVSVGPTLVSTSGNGRKRGWARTYRASKKLNNTVGKLTYTANSYMSVTTTGAALPNDFASGVGLFATSDSTVFCVGTSNNISSSKANDTLSNRSYYIWKGTRTPADTLKWEMVKKLTPSLFFRKSSTGDLSNLIPDLNITFGPSGKVGYVVANGLFKTTVAPTHNNRKFYIAKTTDYGKTWKYIGSPTLEAIPLIKNSLRSINGSTEKRAAPRDDFAVTVDAKDSLHIFCEIAGQRSKNADSLGYFYGGPSGNRYYDITLVDTSKTGFSAYLIDSVEVREYVWHTLTSGTKYYNTLRANLSRTNDGKKIFYTWTDSDPASSLEIDGTKRRSSPDAVIMARDIITRKWTKAKVATANTAASEVYSYGFSCPVIITNTTTADFKYEIPMGYTEHGSSPYDLTEVKYISDMGFNESDFSYDTPNNTTFKLGLFNPEKINLALKIFPNPNAGIFTIKTGVTDNYSVHVTDILGRTVLEKSTKHSNSIKMDMSTFQKGIYFVSLHNSKGFASSKVMIK